MNPLKKESLELDELFKKAFTPVPPHPSHAPPQQPPMVDPSTGQPMAGPVNPATGEPIGGAPVPPAAPAVPQIDPASLQDLLTNMATTVKELTDRVSFVEREAERRTQELEQRLEHDRQLREERKKAIDEALAFGESVALNDPDQI